MRFLIDTNVVVDVLQNREPMAEHGRKIFLAAARQQFVGCITAKEVADLHFFARKQFRGQENVDEEARGIIAKLLALFEVSDTTGSDCRAALGIQNGDYEDAMMIAAALREHLDGIVTGNERHFATASLPVYTPDKFIVLL